MKRIAVLCIGAVLLAALSGCLYFPGPSVESNITLLSKEGVIYAPKVCGMPFGYDANVQPGDAIEWDFRPGIDQYGNPTGFSDGRYTLDEVHFQCPEKALADTIFWPRNLGPNRCVSFPGWTAPIESISGLPLPFMPLEGYPWQSCGSHVIEPMPSQVGILSASGIADRIEVGLVLPEIEEGEYLIEWPGIPIAERTLACVVSEWLSGPGTIIVTCPDGEILEFSVPIGWFLIDNSWPINVGPSGVCN